MTGASKAMGELRKQMQPDYVSPYLNIHLRTIEQVKADMAKVRGER